ncbi:MAG: zinc metalloprotease [Proteobacteria bacterium]|nr:zinc metalloprotease [Pseudomonadota bacterium]MBU1058845.1 zinc metalloprotease [Pseudomonadota bacterium]
MYKQLLLLVMWALSFASFAVAEDVDFHLAADGSIAIQGLRFNDMESYLGSDFFRQQGMRCGTKPPLASGAESVMARSVVDCTATMTSIQEEYWPSAVIYVMPVWFHVIYRSDGTGYVTDERIKAQIQVLNEDYGAMLGSMGGDGYDTRIQFELVGITRTENDTWFDSDDQEAYKPVLNKDPASYINVYSTSASGYLGYAYFPQDSAGQWWDGIVLLHAVVGGRYNGFSLYNQGRTLVHEMGHYLGLYHTFEGYAACINSYTGGDLIVDTPAEEEDHYGCSQTYTCGSPDPIHNYMDYTDDICMYQFSAEQANRAVCSLLNYRPATYEVVPDELSGGGGEGTPALGLILIHLLQSE